MYCTTGDQTENVLNDKAVVENSPGIIKTGRSNVLFTSDQYQPLPIVLPVPEPESYVSTYHLIYRTDTPPVPLCIGIHHLPIYPK